ncbi:YheV family putative zinc ribbon protein [Vibrio gangliei]|uniref:YheV family putative zinc ribbon protein n=1 Tax=Vibrio gangliei TaxID=2077090 RepID=UPI000D011D28|nr:YheV family putative zinc ribbon protein [Vibrio gangliei]
MRKRFIAGAKCPLCEQTDSLRVWEQNDIEVVECVECDYVEQKVEQATAKAIENTPRQSDQLIGIFKPE